MTTTSTALSVDALSGEAGNHAVLPPLAYDGTVDLVEIAGMAFDSLLANKVRSLLTMLGVIIGVASVIALLALGNGASAAITGQVQSVGTNLLSIIPGRLSNQGPGATASAASLTVDDVSAIIGLNLPLNGVAPQFNTSGQIVAAAADKSAALMGTTAVALSLNNLTIKDGRFISEADVQDGAAVIVLGSKLAGALFGKGQAVAQTVRINDSTLRVIGVLEAKGGGGFGSIDDRAFIPISFAQQRFPGSRTPDGNHFVVSMITLGVTDSANIDGVQARIGALLRDRHRLKSDGSNDDFTVFNQASFLSILSTITGLLTSFLAAIAGISLLVGGIGIMNIMLVSVTERTREIGLRKAVGARPQDILLQFIVEAVVISLTGGVIGLLLGAAIALAVSISGLLQASIDTGSVILALSFSSAVGLFFGIYPARRASQLNPIDALRYE
ncbi:MAG: ABC transporter permease [Chloroflexi bacterium]|nr:ABC transporter permease [Chloroflexota bacterium]